MNWFRDNVFLASLGAITLIGAGALGFLTFQASTQFDEAQEGYTQAVAKLHGLQNRSPYPSEENLAKARALSDNYKAEVDRFQKQLATLEAPLTPNVGPQQFQDDLRAAVNQIVEKAGQAGVTLPPNFYLGFGQYANGLPSASAAPALARQLSVIKILVQRLIDFKIQALDVLERNPLPEESPAAQAAATPQEGPKNNKRQTGPTVPPLARYPLTLAFTAEQSKFRVAFNSLLGSDQFFIVRSMTVQNTNPGAPPVEVPVDPSTGAVAPEQQPAAPEAGASNNLNVILGRELVKATLMLEMIGFPPTPASATPDAK